MQNNNIIQDFLLFYSNHCKLSLIVLNYIKKNKLPIKLILVDDKLDKIPKFIKTVPTLIIHYKNNQYQTLKANIAFDYIKKLNESNNNQKQDNLIPFMEYEMCGTSNLYSFCGNLTGNNDMIFSPTMIPSQNYSKY
jgi:hypothetical protein